MATVKDILAWLDALAPFRYAASWDQCGLQVGDPDAEVDRVLVALDPNTGTLKEADEQACQCLVTHHPLIFRPLNAVRMDQYPGKLIATALTKGIHLIAAHTNLDVVQEGTNDQVAYLLTLESTVPLEADGAWQNAERYVGMGRVGDLPHSMTLKDLAGKLKRALGLESVRVVGARQTPIRRVALCTGSGGSLIGLAIASGADAYITGDVKYHEAQSALEAGLSVIDIGHFASERLIVHPLASYLRSRASIHQEKMEVLIAGKERDPFQIDVS